ncbi:hypothetical protein E2C01_059720 [Portunus trituberculatus]|uniref:Uncharacterized protein n=1 Tax=Portunus trituberculatus TaxID=210409 RepID=A0A5B7H3C8_PORTR|nr:hypothetical protein [Portunus trituberculatus]
MTSLPSSSSFSSASLTNPPLTITFIDPSYFRSSLHLPTSSSSSSSFLLLFLLSERKVCGRRVRIGRDGLKRWSNDWLICILMNFADSHITLSLYILVITRTAMVYLPLLMLRREEIRAVEVGGSMIYGQRRERVRQVRRGQRWAGTLGRPGARGQVDKRVGGTQ